jgi:putative addiction module CopG family antidote
MDLPRRAVNLTLSPELAGFLDNCVQSGRFRSASEAVEEALRLLQRQSHPAHDPFEPLRNTLERSRLDALLGDLLDGPCRVRGSGRSR